MSDSPSVSRLLYYTAARVPVAEIDRLDDLVKKEVLSLDDLVAIEQNACLVHRNHVEGMRVLSERIDHYESER